MEEEIHYSNDHVRVHICVYMERDTAKLLIKCNLDLNFVVRAARKWLSIKETKDGNTGARKINIRTW